MTTFPRGILAQTHKGEFAIVENLANQTFFNRAQNQRVRESIFRIIRNIPNVLVIKFPVEDLALNAFTMKRANEFFIYINTAQPRDLQNFAAAHELYHVLYEDEEFWRRKSGEVLTEVESSYNGELNEMKANGFAACFLVPRHELLREISSLGIKEGDIQLLDVVKLMDAFGVPYKTMVLRLFEAELIDLALTEAFLEIPDRDPKAGVQLLINQTRYGVEWQRSGRETEYSNLIPLLVNNFREGLIDYKDLQNDFSLIGENVDDYLPADET